MKKDVSDGEARRIEGVAQAIAGRQSREPESNDQIKRVIDALPNPPKQQRNPNEGGRKQPRTLPQD